MSSHLIVCNTCYIPKNILVKEVCVLTCKIYYATALRADNESENYQNAFLTTKAE